jgi:hypothetical protein
LKVLTLIVLSDMVPLELDELPEVLVDAEEDGSLVPVTEISWPTWSVRLAVLPANLYVVPDGSPGRLP